MSSEQSAEQPSEATAEVRGSWRDVELAWAREQLHVETDGPEGVWQSLQRCGFLPDGAQIAALEILAGTAPLECSPATADYRRLARREALQCEIEAFAGRFFEHSPPEREAVWRELRERCGEFPEFVDRLEFLKAGLFVVRPETEGLDEDCRRVVDGICSMFVASPAAKSCLQRSLVNQLSFNQRGLARTIRKVQQFDPALASLTPSLLLRQIDGPLSVSDVDHLSKKLRRSTWRIRARSRLMLDPWLVTGLLGGVMAAALMIWQQPRRHREIRNFSVVQPASPSRLQELSAAVNRQSQRIRSYGIAQAEPLELPGGQRMKRYRILGPGPEEFLLDANLTLMGIEAAHYLREDVGKKTDD